MADYLQPSIRGYLSEENETCTRFERTSTLAKSLSITEEEARYIALAAGALYELPRITLINKERMQRYMKHLYRVPETSKVVKKEFVRIGEGSITYSIGRHRFIEMARAAGAVYKINEGTGGTVLVNLDIFDQYIEQFKEEPVPMKKPLWKAEEVE